MMKIENRDFCVNLPSTKGCVIIQIPMEWDEEIQEWLMTEEGMEQVEEVKRKNKELDWVDDGGYRVYAKTDDGEYVVTYDDGLWGYIFPKEEGYRGFDTFGGAKQRCEEHYEQTKTILE